MEGGWKLERKAKRIFTKQKLTNYDMYQLVRKMLDDFNEDVANNQQIDTSRLYKFINLTEEMLKPKSKELTLKELLKIALKEYNIEDDLYNDDDDDWEIDF